MACLTCGRPLSGRQTKFCSLSCKSVNTNLRHQSYEAQQRRGWERKLILVKEAGGACKRCGYRQNLAALCFHHRDGHERAGRSDGIRLSIRECSNNKMSKLRAEASRCDLLCHNCHMEVHFPACDIPTIDEFGVHVALSGCGLAQQVERSTHNAEVVGSSPTPAPKALQGRHDLAISEGLGHKTREARSMSAIDSAWRSGGGAERLGTEAGPRLPRLNLRRAAPGPRA